VGCLLTSPKICHPERSEPEGPHFAVAVVLLSVIPEGDLLLSLLLGGSNGLQAAENDPQKLKGFSPG
jgi:hypothetical protein